MKRELRRFSSKKLYLAPQQKETFRKRFDELRNRYEHRNKGMFDIIYPILDEMTLDPVEDQMKPY